MARQALPLLTLWAGMAGALRHDGMQHQIALAERDNRTKAQGHSLLTAVELRALVPLPFVDIGMADVSGIVHDLPNMMPDTTAAATSMTEAVFWSAKGTFVRVFGDTVMPWYLKYFGTSSQRTEYTGGLMCRWLSENPGKTAAAAATAVAAGGLFYYWYRSRRPKEKAVQQMLLDMQNLPAKDSNKTLEKAHQFALDEEGLVSAQALLLAAAIRGDCQLKWWRAQDFMKDEELVQYLRHPEETNEAVSSLGPLLARCHERPVQQLAWSSAKELMPQLRLLGFFASNLTALA